MGKERHVDNGNSFGTDIETFQDCCPFVLLGRLVGNGDLMCVRAVVIDGVWGCQARKGDVMTVNVNVPASHRSRSAQQRSVRRVVLATVAVRPSSQTRSDGRLQERAPQADLKSLLQARARRRAVLRGRDWNEASSSHHPRACGHERALDLTRRLSHSLPRPRV